MVLFYYTRGSKCSKFNVLMFDGVRVEEIHINILWIPTSPTLLLNFRHFRRVYYPKYWKWYEK